MTKNEKWNERNIVDKSINQLFSSRYDTICFMISKPVPLQHFWSLIIPLEPMTWLGFILTGMAVRVMKFSNGGYKIATNLNFGTKNKGRMK